MSRPTVKGGKVIRWNERNRDGVGRGGDMRKNRIVIIIIGAQKTGNKL